MPHDSDARGFIGSTDEIASQAHPSRRPLGRGTGYRLVSIGKFDPVSPRFCVITAVAASASCAAGADECGRWRCRDELEIVFIGNVSGPDVHRPMAINGFQANDAIEQRHGFLFGVGI